MSFYPGDTTADDWDDSAYIFWSDLDPHTGEQTGISRSDLKRDSRGRIKPGQRDARSVFCEEHFDWELARVPISAVQALEWVNAPTTDSKEREAASLTEPKGGEK